MASFTIDAMEFKAKCLSILDEVEASGNTVTVTKRGRPVATAGPVAKKKFKSLKRALEGIIHIPDAVLEANRVHLRQALQKRHP
jgi:prevent-host-death family protein